MNLGVISKTDYMIITLKQMSCIYTWMQCNAKSSVKKPNMFEINVNHTIRSSNVKYFHTYNLSDFVRKLVITTVTVIGGILQCLYTLNQNRWLHDTGEEITVWSTSDFKRDLSENLCNIWSDGINNRGKYSTFFIILKISRWSPCWPFCRVWILLWVET